MLCCNILFFGEEAGICCRSNVFVVSRGEVSLCELKVCGCRATVKGKLVLSLKLVAEQRLWSAEQVS